MTLGEDTLSQRRGRVNSMGDSDNTLNDLILDDSVTELVESVNLNLTMRGTKTKAEYTSSV